jgi:hypothetical protein
MKYVSKNKYFFLTFVGLTQRLDDKILSGLFFINVLEIMEHSIENKQVCFLAIFSFGSSSQIT